MGLRLWPADERTASPTTTAVRIPAGIEDAALRAAVRSHYGVVFSQEGVRLPRAPAHRPYAGASAQPVYALSP